MHSPLRHARSLFLKTRPIQLTYFVTRRCNARCPFCFYAAARDAAEAPPELSADEVRRVADSLGPLLWVLFSGGEPFLRDDLPELSGIFHDRNRPAFLTYPTNGLLPERIVEATGEILRRCPRSVVVVKLSLDGVGERHDALRGTPGGFARAMRTYEGLAALAERHQNLELGVNTVFSPENQWELGELVDMVHGLPAIRAHTLSLLRPAPPPSPAHGDGRAEGSGAEPLDLRQYRAVSRQLEALWSARRGRFHRFAGARLKAAQDRLQRRLIQRTLEERRRVLPCYAGRLSLVLTESGALHPCETRWERCFGNVREAGHDAAALLRTPRGRALVDEIARGDCWCSHECNFLTSILFDPRTQPALVREWARPRAGTEREVTA